jgi:hypothetical protein
MEGEGWDCAGCWPDIHQFRVLNCYYLLLSQSQSRQAGIPFSLLQPAATVLQLLPWAAMSQDRTGRLVEGCMALLGGGQGARDSTRPAAGGAWRGV